jgi:two-component system LytT family response regulator
MTPERLRILIVDDEPVARGILREELEDLGTIEIVGEAENGEQAIERIYALMPDLVLLDLQMPGMGGFDVVRHLDGPSPAIVIVTAFDQHAIQAFEAGAIDYLLKPVSRERLAKCIDRVRELRRTSSAAAGTLNKLQTIAQQGAASRPRKIVGKLGEEFHLLDSSQVLAFQAERELVWILTRKQRYLATQPLKVLQEKLSDLHFARIHRNALVNLDHVAKMAPLSSQRWLLTLDTQQEFIVSKRQAREVQKILRW